MEGGVDPFGSRPREHVVPSLAVGQQHVEEVVALLPAGGHRGELEAELLGVGGQEGLVAVEHGSSSTEDPVLALELGDQVGRQHVRQAARRPGVCPGVLVDLAEEERRPVGALVVDDTRPLDVFLAVDHQGAALAAGEVLGLVEAEGGEPTEAADEGGRPGGRTSRGRCPRPARRGARPPSPSGGRRGLRPLRRSGWARPPAPWVEDLATRSGSRPRVVGSMSQKWIRAPWRAKASAVVTNPKDGTTTVSPGPTSTASPTSPAPWCTRW